MTKKERFQIRALACDIDGTLTDGDNRRLHLGAVEALRGFGVPVVLSTGNMSCSTYTYARAIGTCSVCISENGGVVSERPGGRECVMGDKEKLKSALQVMKENFKIDLFSEKYRKAEYAMRRTFPVEGGRTLLREHGFDNLELVDSGYALHLKTPGFDKGTGLVKAAEILDMEPKEFAAIGDGATDIEMFEMAGITVAVANAVPELKEVAHFVTEAPSGEGVVEALRYLQTAYMRQVLEPAD